MTAATNEFEQLRQQLKAMPKQHLFMVCLHSKVHRMTIYKFITGATNQMQRLTHERVKQAYEATVQFVRGVV